MNSKLERIFELFYSMRPSGRGLGLYLSRDSLATNYYSIWATNDPEYNTLHGACFRMPLEGYKLYRNNLLPGACISGFQQYSNRVL